MALSREEKISRSKIFHAMETNIDMEVIQEASNSDNSEKKFVDLDEIEKFISGKTAGFNPPKKIDIYYDTDILITILFMDNDITKLDGRNNHLYLAFDVPGSDSNVRANSGFSKQDITDFLELPSKREDGDFKSTSQIVKMCDPEAIYERYQKSALELIRYRMPAAYNMFTGSSIIKSVTNRCRTLQVGYVKRFNKFTYEVNPSFVLLSALDEWFQSKNEYKSFRGCYIYTLAFMITHEMMHIIHHNTNTKVNIDNDKNVLDMLNIIQDSFINSHIVKVFKGVSGTRGIKNGKLQVAPRIKNGIGSDIIIRGEHNVGFKKYNKVEDLFKEVYSVIAKSVKMSGDTDNVRISGGRDDLSEYAGADVFVKVDIKPSANELRANSNIFNSCFNNILSTITDGKVYPGTAKFTDKEKESSKPILPNGTLVQVRGTKGVYIVSSLEDEENKIYGINETDLINVTDVDMGNGVVQKIPTYSDNGKKLGDFRRRDIIPRTVEDLGWFESSKEREKKEKLSDEDIRNANSVGFDSDNDMSNSNNGSTVDNSNKNSNKNSLEILDELIGEDIDLGAMLTICMSRCDNLSVNLDDILDNYKGLSEDEVKLLLGGDLYKEVLKAISDLSKNLMGDDSSGQNGMQGQQNVQQPPQNKPKILRVGDIVWVKRLSKFGKIISIDNGMFEIEEMEEIGVKTLDDSDFHKEV